MISDEEQLKQALERDALRAERPGSPSPRSRIEANPQPDSERPDDSLLDCLIAIGKFHGQTLSPAGILSALPTQEGRLTPRLLIRAAEESGFSARIVKRSISKIPNLVLPCALLLKEQRAALLLSKSEHECKLLLPETGEGETTLSCKELESQYTGHALFVKPRATLYAKEENVDKVMSPGNWFWGSLWRHRRVYRNALLAAVFINLFSIAGSMFVMNVYDRVIPNNAIETLWTLTIGIMIVYAFDFLLRLIRGSLIDSAGKKADIAMSGYIFKQTLGLKLKHRPNSVGSFANKVKGYENLREFFTSATLASLIDLPFSALFVACVYLIAGSVAIIPSVGIVLILLTGLLVHYPLKKSAENAQNASSRKHALLIEALSGLETIKALSAAGSFQRKMENCMSRAAKSEKTARSVSNFATSLSSLFSQVVTVSIVVVSVFRIQEGLMSMGALIACTILSNRAMAPAGQFASLLSRLQQSLQSLRDMNAIMALPQDREQKRNYLQTENTESGLKIEFKDVTFSYADDEYPAIKDASFTIEPGDRVAILGRVGSGKSTLLRLILGFYQPDSGSILINGTDIRQLDPSELHRKMGYIGQENQLFDGSLRENILLGKPWAGESELLEASRLAGVDTFSAEHPNGYDMQIGERGERLSGGQRQAINVARALLSRPITLTMDEPTSAIDANAERSFIANIEAFCLEKGRSLILSTHKPAMLKLADRIIVLDHGRIVANGPKAEVMRQLSQGMGKN